MTILFVCHSVGDTNALLATAKQLSLSKTAEKVLFLVVGQAAKTIFDNQKTKDLLNSFSFISVINLADIFDNDTMLSLENKGLEPEQRKTVKYFLQAHHISRALIGTPSQLNALVPFQIAEEIADYLQDGAGLIFNDYFFKEDQHVYWQLLENKFTSTRDWRKKFTWLAPLPSTARMITDCNHNFKTQVVGHPSIDEILEQKTLPSHELSQTRDLLKVQPQQSLLFISGTKDIEADSQLLKSLLASLEQSAHAAIQLRMGIHPGIAAAQINSYLRALIDVVNLFPSLATNVNFIINDTLATRIDAALLQQPCFIKANINGDVASAAADGVACAVPATLVNKAAILGQPAYYHQADKKTFLAQDKLCAGEKSLPLFFNQVGTKTRKQTATKQDLGVPSQTAADTMVRMLLSK